MPLPSDPNERLAMLAELLKDELVCQVLEAKFNPKSPTRVAAGVTPTSKGYANAGRNAYYNAENGARIKPTLEKMLITRQSMGFSYRRFPNIKPNTVYQMFVNAVAYACDNLDPDGKLKEFRTKFTINQGVAGVIFQMAKGETPIDQLIPFTADVLDGPMSNDWTDQLRDFIAVSEMGEKYEKTGIMFSPVEIDIIKRAVSNPPEGKQFMIKRLDPMRLELVNITGLLADPLAAKPEPESDLYVGDVEDSEP